MNRKVLIPIVVVILLAATVIPALAISDGEQDNGRHPFVGLMVAQTAGGRPLWRCSGTLISPTIFLTAGHCTQPPAARVETWFHDDLEPTPGIYGYPSTGQVGGTPHTHPQYNPSAFYLHDLGVVVLKEPMVMAEYGALPMLGQLNSLKTRRGLQDVTFTAVGYGMQMSFPDAASWKNQAFLTRMVAYPRLIQINGGLVGDYSLLLSNNANTGGTCFGDSGGPNFIGSGPTETRVIAGVTSFGMNGNCAGTGGVYRIDQADDLRWLATFIDD